MNMALHFPKTFALTHDIPVVAKRNGKTVPAYLRERMTEALMADVATDVLSRYDFSSDAHIDGALRRFSDLSDELIDAIAHFKYDARRRRFLRKLRDANTEGTFTAAQRDIFQGIVRREEEFSIVKAIAHLEARRRGLKAGKLPRRMRASLRSK